MKNMFKQAASQPYLISAHREQTQSSQSFHWPCHTNPFLQKRTCKMDSLEHSSLPRSRFVPCPRQKACTEHPFGRAAGWEGEGKAGHSSARSFRNDSASHSGQQKHRQYSQIHMNGHIILFVCLF